MINDTKVMDSVREILAGTMPAEVKLEWIKKIIKVSENGYYNNEMLKRELYEFTEEDIAHYEKTGLYLNYR